MHRKILFVSAVTAVTLMAVSACSSTSRGGSSNAPNAPGSAPASTAQNATPVQTAAKFGTLDSPCGKGNASAATAQGVTAKSISIAYGDDRGFSVQPGLNKSMGDAVKAMISWCNAQGGINGRKIDGDFYDAAVLNIAPAIKTACAKDFMLVGEGWASDELAEQPRVACGLPAVPGYAIGPDFANGPMMYQAVPLPDDQQPSSILYQIAKLFPDAKSAFGTATNTLPAAQTAVAKVTAAAGVAGYKVVNCGVTMNYQGEPDYTPFAQKFKACGAKVIYLPTPGPETNGLITAMHRIGEDPIYIMQANGYTQAFAQWNTAGYGNKVYVQSSLEPIENADAVPAVKQYLSIVKANGGATDLLGEQSTSSFLLWATAAKSCGDELTRQCMVNELSKTTSWTGGGLTAEQDPGANKTTQCGLLMKLDGTKWVQAYPSTQGQFECNSEYAVTLPKSVWFAKLNSDRIATQFLTASVLKPQS